MIAHLSGTLRHKSPTHVILDVGGVGYEVKISPHTYTQLSSASQAMLYTHFHVKEDAQTLYGFQTMEEKTTFLALISVKGVGPNIAILVLSAMRPGELGLAIAQGDTTKIQAVKGIGTKVAQRIVLELKDRLGDLAAVALEAGMKVGSLQAEALQGLVHLGIPKPTAQAAIQQICKSATEPLTVEVLIRQVLQGAQR